jgi:prepilin-type N-terminal cleavage/methylation domain-containing protein
MLTRRPHLRSSAQGEHGFTLIEVLVAMLAGVVVTGALFLILEVSLFQSTRIRNETSADQVGRTAMTTIVDELHSACFYADLAPVLERSTPQTLIFENATGAQGAPPEAYRRHITFATSTSTKESTLTEEAWKNTIGSSWPNFQFNESEKATLVKQLATHISESPEAPAPAGIFRYFRYASATSSTTGGVSSLELSHPLEGSGTHHELSSEEASTVAAVEIKFNAAGSSTTNPQLEHTINLSNIVDLSFTVPRTETPISDGPCE